MHLPCKHCDEDRRDGKFTKATQCTPCGGTGIVLAGERLRCNGCGGTLSNDFCKEHEVVGLPLVKVDGQYQSTHLNELHTYSFSICEICLRKMFESFVIPPKVLTFAKGEITYEEDLDKHRQNLWLNEKGDLQKLSTGLCNRTKDCPNRAEFRELRIDGVGEKNYCNFHAEEWGCAGHVWAPTEEIGAMLEPSSTQEWLTLARVFLERVARPTPYGTYWRHAPPLFLRAIGQPPDKSLSCLYVPRGWNKEVPSLATYIGQATFGSDSFDLGIGVFFYGKIDCFEFEKKVGYKEGIKFAPTSYDKESLLDMDSGKPRRPPEKLFLEEPSTRKTLKQLPPSEP